jgi:hypothetical protein
MVTIGRLFSEYSARFRPLLHNLLHTARGDSARLTIRFDTRRAESEDLFEITESDFFSDKYDENFFEVDVIGVLLIGVARS